MCLESAGNLHWSSSSLNTSRTHKSMHWAPWTTFFSAAVINETGRLVWDPPHLETTFSASSWMSLDPILITRIESFGMPIEGLSKTLGSSHEKLWLLAKISSNARQQNRHGLDWSKELQDSRQLGTCSKKWNAVGTRYTRSVLTARCIEKFQRPSANSFSFWFFCDPADYMSIPRTIVRGLRESIPQFSSHLDSMTSANSRVYYCKNDSASWFPSQFMAYFDFLFDLD